jgi:catechol 2,3-dioxygenase-like lactoylglutathione lyase family enzyme
MHKSRLAGFIIDCDTPDLDEAARFWSAALGLPIAPGEEPPYVGLATRAHSLHVEVQQVTHPSRVHLDIETDDIAAEVARLEALGATRIGEVQRWVVMQAPTGQRFCVVRSRAEDFAETANAWP